MKSKLRIYMAALLCGGLLLVGIGVGVGFVEFSSFSYAGERSPKGSSKTQTLRVELDQDATRINMELVSFSDSLVERSSDLAIFYEEDDAISAGTAECDVTYVTSGPPPQFYYNSYLNTDAPEDMPQQTYHQTVSLYSYLTAAAATEAVLSVKDKILADLKNDQLGYYTCIQIQSVTVRVHPTDIDRIVQK